MTPIMKSRFNSAVTVLLITCLTALLAWLSVRYQWQFDWTNTGRHTLSEASMTMLAHADKPLKVDAYARDEVALRSAIEKLVARYKKVKDDIELRFINPDLEPDLVRALGISVNGELVLHYKGRSENLKYGSEEGFTNALGRLVRGAKHWLAFVEGHGERDSVGRANHDLGDWTGHLKNRGFKIQPINLAQMKTIPHNVQVLIIAGPRVNFLPGEVEVIKEYVARGGNLLWLTDPDTQPRLELLAEQLTVKILDGLVVDLSSSMVGIDDPTIVLNTAKIYPNHQATEGFHYSTVFPKAAAIGLLPTDIWEQKSLLVSHERSWRETDAQQFQFDVDVDQRGPLNIAVSLEREVAFETEPEIYHKLQRVVVVGDGDFLSNAYLNNSGNLDLGIRFINWLINDTDFINIPARSINDAQLELSYLEAGIMGLGFLLLLPVLFLSVGATLWWKKRKL